MSQDFQSTTTRYLEALKDYRLANVASTSMALLLPRLLYWSTRIAGQNAVDRNVANYNTHQ